MMPGAVVIPFVAHPSPSKPTSELEQLRKDAERVKRVASDVASFRTAHEIAPLFGGEVDKVRERSALVRLDAVIAAMRTTEETILAKLLNGEYVHPVGVLSALVDASARVRAAMVAAENARRPVAVVLDLAAYRARPSSKGVA